MIDEVNYECVHIMGWTEVRDGGEFSMYLCVVSLCHLASLGTVHVHVFNGNCGENGEGWLGRGWGRHGGGEEKSVQLRTSVLVSQGYHLKKKKCNLGNISTLPCLSCLPLSVICVYWNDHRLYL
jgi:hypothetical protein